MSEKEPLASGEGRKDYTEGDAERGLTPPTPRSLFQEIKDAKHESTGPCDFVKRFFMILFGTIGFILFVGILLALPIAMIVVGSLNLNECPLEHYIPIWLIVSGAIFGFLQLSFIYNSISDKEKGEEKGKMLGGFFNFLLSAFSFAWFITGNVWVFSHFTEVSSDVDSDLFCKPSVYYFSFWLIIVAYIWMFFACCCSGVVAVVGLRDVAKKVTTITQAKKSASGSEEAATSEGAK